jgi:hypothetical protein
VQRPLPPPLLWTRAVAAQALCFRYRFTNSSPLRPLLLDDTVAVMSYHERFGTLFADTAAASITRASST